MEEWGLVSKEEVFTHFLYQKLSQTNKEKTLPPNKFFTCIDFRKTVHCNKKRLRWSAGVKKRQEI